MPFYESPELFNIIGHFMGDGNITKKSHTASYNNTDESLLYIFEKNIRKVFGDVKLTVCLDGSNKKILVPSSIRQIICRMYPEIQKKSIEMLVPERIINSPLKYKKEFLKSIMDDEGTVGYLRQSQLKVYSSSNIINFFYCPKRHIVIAISFTTTFGTIPSTNCRMKNGLFSFRVF